MDGEKIHKNKRRFILNKFYGILRTAKKGTGVCMYGEDGKLMFPHGSCKYLKPGPIVVKHVIDKGNYLQLIAKPYKMSAPSEAELVKYLSSNIQPGMILEMTDEEFGNFFVAPNGDVLTNDERNKLYVIGKGFHLERRLEARSAFQPGGVLYHVVRPFG